MGSCHKDHHDCKPTCTRQASTTGAVQARPLPLYLQTTCRPWTQPRCLLKVCIDVKSMPSLTRKVWRLFELGGAGALLGGGGKFGSFGEFFGGWRGPGLAQPALLVRLVGLSAVVALVM